MTLSGEMTARVAVAVLVGIALAAVQMRFIRAAEQKRKPDDHMFFSSTLITAGLVDLVAGLFLGLLIAGDGWGMPLMQVILFAPVVWWTVRGIMSSYGHETADLTARATAESGTPTGDGGHALLSISGIRAERFDRARAAFVERRRSAFRRRPVLHSLIFAVAMWQAVGAAIGLVSAIRIGRALEAALFAAALIGLLALIVLPRRAALGALLDRARG